MAINVNTPVASRVRGGPSALELIQNFTRSSPAAIPDPRADIMATIGSVPEQRPDQSIPRGIPVLESGSSIETPQDIVDATGAPFLPQADQEVVVDEDGMPVLDEMGNKQYRPIAPSDYDKQLATEQASHFGVKEGVGAMAQGQGVPGMRTLFQAEQDAAATGWGLNSRSEQKLETRTKTLDSFIQSSANDLEQMQFNADNAIFGGEMADKSKALIRVEGGKIPVGYQVMADAGLTDRESRQVISTLAGLAFNQALTQAGVHRDRQDNTVEGQQSASDLGEGLGKDYQSNMINATAHALNQGLRNMGIKLADNGVDLIAKAIVTHNQNEEYLIPSADKSGRIILEAAPELKRQAMQLQRVSEAVTGETKRKGASSTPTASGTSFTLGRPGLTKGAVSGELDGEVIVTRTADLVKSIMGAVAQVFRPKDFKRKSLEIAMCLAPAFVTEIDGRFAWSTHPFASRNNLHKGAYDAAYHKVRRPLDFDPNSPVDDRAFKKMQQEGALKAVGEIRAMAEFDMLNVEKSKGLLYSHWIHSTSNQRFYPNSYNTDYMGSKNIIRDVMGLADQDTVRAIDLFNPQAIAIMLRKADAVFKGNGVAVQKNLESLSPNELGALGTMRNAVMYYYTAIEPKKVHNITKYSPLEVIQMYNPTIANKLADLGAKYNAYLNDPKSEPDNEMMSLWVATEKGEALGTLNLWDDFARAKVMADNPVTARHSFATTHHAFSDGNQNGIFLQALFFGLKDANQSFDSGLRLSVADPNMDDMRLFGMDTMVANLKANLEAEPEKAQAWAAFFYDAIQANADDRTGVAKDFFKKPLMQNAYGKDASMFGDMLLDLLEIGEPYATLARKHFTETGVYRDMMDAGTDLSGAVEGTLRSIIDSSSVHMMKNIGRFGAVTNNPFLLEGISGDTLAIVPVGAQPVNKEVSSGSYVPVTTKAGERVLLKAPSYVSDTLTNPETGEEVDLPTYRMGIQPTKSRGTQMFWDRRGKEYDEFGNALGSMQSRQLAVLLIQAMDGDLVKYTIAEANKNRLLKGGNEKRNPFPVLFVHDSIIGTPGSSLIYDNVYNNVAIPAAIPEMAKMGKRIQNAVQRMRAKEVAKVERRGEPVGIGAIGDYPALGAVFDEIYKNTIEKGAPEDYAPGKQMPKDYKAYFLKTRRLQEKMAARKKKGQMPQKVFDRTRKDSEGLFDSSPEGKWETKKAQMQSILKDAQALGWIYPDDLPEQQREMLTIPAANFAKMLDLAGEYLKMDKMKPWTDDHARRVNNGAERLFRRTQEKGILQMAAGGGKAASKKGYNPVPLEKAQPEKVVPMPKIGPMPDLDKMFDTNEKIPF